MILKRTFIVEITVNAEMTQEVYDEAPTIDEWEYEVRKVIEQNLIHMVEDGVTYGLEITSKEDVSEQYLTTAIRGNALFNNRYFTVAQT